MTAGTERLDASMEMNGSTAATDNGIQSIHDFAVREVGGSILVLQYVDDNLIGQVIGLRGQGGELHPGGESLGH